MTDTTTTTTVTRRGRPRVRPVDQPRDYAGEYSRRKAGAQKRGEVTTVTNPVNANDRMQSPDWRYTLAYAGWLAWASGKPQAVVLQLGRRDRWQYDITCALDHPDAVWVVLPPVAMPRLPCDV